MNHMLRNLQKLSIAALVCAQLHSSAQCVNWVHRTTVGTPGQRAHHAMAYDSDRGVTVFFGGEIGETGSETYYADTWEYDGNQWTQIICPTNPPARSFHAMAYDTNFQQVLMVGGQTGGGAFNDVWSYQHTGGNAPNWTHIGAYPSAVAGHGLVYSTHNKWFEGVSGATRIYGSSGFAALDKVYLYDHYGSWTNIYTTSQAYGIGLTYDTLRGAVVGVGGYTQSDESGLVSPYWSAWAANEDPNAEQYPTNIHTGPLSRAESAVAYDSNRDRTVCVGGDNGINGTEEEVWEYSPATAWIQGTYLPSGYGRAGAAMVFDSKRNVMVLMGGAGINAPNGNNGGRWDDTWELTPAAAPTITFTPSGQLCRNTDITYTPSVSTSRPLTYQWYERNSVGNWETIPAETNLTLSVPAAQLWFFNYGFGVSLDDPLVVSGGQTPLKLIATDTCGSPYTTTGMVNIVAPPLNTPNEFFGADIGNTNDNDNAGIYFRCPGDSISFHAHNIYIGNVPNPTYQWYRSGAAIPGGSVDFISEPHLDLTNLQPSDTGDYFVRIFNACGNCESLHAHLQVGVTISQQPTNQNVNPCQPAYFGVTAQGVGALHYQWRFKGAPLTNDSFHAGVTTSLLTVAPTLYDLEGPYDCVIYDDCGPQYAVTSTVGVLTLPPPIWILRSTNGPSQRYANAMAYDSKRDVTVLWGGGHLDSNVGYRGYGELWEWNGVHWRQRTTYNESNAWHQDINGYWVQNYTNTPAARLQHAMAYDTRRGRVVMFGGRGGPNNVYGDYEFNDTWEWDGSQWHFRTTNGPPAQFDHHMAYDPGRGVTVLYGGFGVAPNVVWEWDGTNWNSVTFSNGPSASYSQTDACMDYDTVLGQIFVGPTTDGFTERFFWGWNGSWIDRGTGFFDGNATAPPKYPPPLAAMVYDTYRNRSLYYGGQDNGQAGNIGGSTTAYYQSGSGEFGGGWTVLPDMVQTSLFGPNDFVNVTALSAKLGGQIDSVSQFLWNQFSAGTQQVLTNSGSTPDQQKTALIPALNGILQNTNIYDATRFNGVFLSPETLSFLVLTNLYGKDIVRFNRLLIEDSYPAEIARSLSTPAGRKLHAMAFDSARKTAVVQGGYYYDYLTLNGNETWELHYVDQPMINDQPASQYRAPGDTAIFNVNAHPPVGGSLTYAWYFGNTPLNDSGRISGAHSATLRIANVNTNDAGQYIAHVFDDCSMVTTAPAILTTDPKLQIFSATSGSAQLVWSAANLILEQADTVIGPWSTVLNASSPYDLSLEGPGKFFRLNTNTPAGP